MCLGLNEVILFNLTCKELFLRSLFMKVIPTFRHTYDILQMQLHSHFWIQKPKADEGVERITTEDAIDIYHHWETIKEDKTVYDGF